MNPGQSPASSRKAPGKRVSLACLPCRSAHVKCNAKRPCNRCSLENKECFYAKSRRGGLDRAALAARRNKASANPFLSPESPPTAIQARNIGWEEGDVSVSSGRCHRGTNDTLAIPGWNSQHLHAQDSNSVNLAEDPLVDLYYRHFHKCHPLIVPLPHLKRLLRMRITNLNFHPLLAVIRFIGSLYSRSVDSNELEAIATNTILEQSSQNPPSPVMTQCYLLQSIALHWCDKLERAREMMDTAIRIALQLSMNHAVFAVNNGEDDPIIQESWRRTWWQIYIIDGHYAAIRQASTFPTNEVEITTELPCDEEEYESGIIPTSKTLADFDSREFASDEPLFSSFAYLIGAVRGIASAISRFLSSVASRGDSLNVLEAVDAAIDGWLLLLPESKKITVSASGETDEHMFQAHMAIHAAAIGLHRPLSELSYSSLENWSSCSAAPPEVSSSLPLSIRCIHTARCLKSIECQVRLIAIATKPAYNTPFTVCMLASAIITHISACKLILSGQKLAIARDQIRMCIGYLRLLAGVWPLADRTLREVQTVAREVLDLIQPQQRTEPVDSSLETASSNQDNMPATVIPDSLLNYLNFDDLDLYISSRFADCG